MSVITYEQLQKMNRTLENIAEINAAILRQLAAIHAKLEKK